jgi:hypothetical protein
MSKPKPSRLIPAPPMPKRKGRGFTLLETAIAVLLMSLIFFGTLTLFTGVERTGLKVTAASTASVTSAQAVQSVCDDLKEAYWAALPGDTAPVAWPSGFIASKFHNGPYNTGICIYAPVTTTASLAGLASTVTVLNRSATGQAAYLIYRGDSDTTPDPNGSYLWKQYLQVTQDPTLIASNISSDSRAVQFRRLTSGLTNSIEVKIVCGEWSREIGEQTADTTNGTKVTGIAGRTVLLRNTSVTTLAVTSAYNNPFGTPTPVPTPSPTPTTAPTSTPTPSPTPTKAPTPSPTPTKAPTPTPSPTPTKAPTPTPTPKPTPTPTPTPKPTPKPTPTPTPPPLVGAG